MSMLMTCWESAASAVLEWVNNVRGQLGMSEKPYVVYIHPHVHAAIPWTFVRRLSVQAHFALEAVLTTVVVAR